MSLVMVIVQFQSSLDICISCLNLAPTKLQNIGLCIDEKTDAYTLRQQFVDHVQSNEHNQLLTGISADKLNEETELFHEKGTFCGNLGDLVIRVCSDILRIPLLVIKSLAQHTAVGLSPSSLMIHWLCLPFTLHITTMVLGIMMEFSFQVCRTFLRKSLLNC